MVYCRSGNAAGPSSSSWASWSLQWDHHCECESASVIHVHLQCPRTWLRAGEIINRKTAKAIHSFATRHIGFGQPCSRGLKATFSCRRRSATASIYLQMTPTAIVTDSRPGASATWIHVKWQSDKLAYKLASSIGRSVGRSQCCVVYCIITPYRNQRQTASLSRMLSTTYSRAYV